MRNTEVANGCREDIDTALLKLYTEQNHDSLLDLLASDNACVLADSVPWLEKYHKCVVLSVHLLKFLGTGLCFQAAVVAGMLRG